MGRISRRNFLDLSAAVAAMTASGCLGNMGEGPAAGEADGGDASIDGAVPDGLAGPAVGVDGEPLGPPGPNSVGIAGFENLADRAAAVQAAVELAGGMPWITPGDTVLIKVAHNSPNAYPAVSSPTSCAELVKLCLDAGASRVYVADLMGIENTLVPGGWSLEDPKGKGFNANTDGTIRAFHESGIWDAVVNAVGAENVGPNGKVHLTSFREHGWWRWESAADINGTPYLQADWVKEQLERAEPWDKKPVTPKYIKRQFDWFREDVPGMYVPNLITDVDHIINLHRVSTHVMSHYSLALKNWVGIMRPDDRMWMHQISYLLNHLATGDDPLRSEPPYNLIFAELHGTTWERERLVFADATEVIASGGPDVSDKDFFPAQLMVAAKDVVAADVVGLSILKQAVLTSKMAGGLGGECSPPPQSAGKLIVGVLAARAVPWTSGIYGNDSKLCDPGFSPWDWVAVQRAREIGIGCPSPNELDVRFASSGPFEVPDATCDFLAQQTSLAPAYAL